MTAGDKPIVWLHGEIRTPPFSRSARVEAGYLLRRLQVGESLSLPQARPLPSIGARCLELRLNDAGVAWRMVVRVDRDAVVLLDVFAKKTRATPPDVIARCRRRLASYDRVARSGERP